MDILKKLNRIFDTASKIKMLILFFGIIIGALIEMTALAMLAPFLEVVLDGAAVDTNRFLGYINNLFGFDDVPSLIAFFAFLLAAAYILRSVYNFMLNRIRMIFFSRRQALYSKQMLSKLLSFSYLYHTHKNIAEVQRIILEDIQKLFQLISYIFTFLVDFFMTVFMLGYLFYESPGITSCVLGLTLSCVVVYFTVFRKRIHKMGTVDRESRIAMRKAVQQVFGGIKEVKVTHRESYFEKVYCKARDLFVKTDIRFKIVSNLPTLMIEVMCYGGAFVLIGLFTLRGADISGLVPQLALFVVAAFRILPSITKQVNGINEIIHGKPSVDAVYRNLFEEKDIAAVVRDYTPGDVSAGDTAANISICNVSFSYPKIIAPVIENVSFVIPENKSVALVGPSGAGKSTLADLILGVLTPNEGNITYKGKSIYSDPLWSKNIGYIPQFIYLLDESILENVAFGIKRSRTDDEKVWRALEQAQLKDFVISLPDGIDTVIGDRGVRLSGGQRQRIGIARAMYEDPPILVLDEATSSLDNETEIAVMEAIMGFHGNKTILIIAHRLSTIEHCDIVYRVEDKKVFRER